MLNNIDLVKDLQYLIFRMHTAIFTLAYCATIVVPIFLTIWSTKMLIHAMRDDEGRPKEIKELRFIFNAINQQMGYVSSDKNLDSAQWKYNSDMTVKLIENVPQTIMVSQESFMSSYTIRFDQLAFPIFGIFSAALTFSTQIGNLFIASYVYIFFDEFRIKVPEGLTENEIKWHRKLKPIIVDSKEVTPEMWQ